MQTLDNSSVAATDIFNEGGGPKSRFLCVLAAPKGVARIQAAHPDVPIITAISDACLNKNVTLLGA